MAQYTLPSQRRAGFGRRSVTQMGMVCSGPGRKPLSARTASRGNCISGQFPTVCGCSTNATIHHALTPHICFLVRSSTTFKTCSPRGGHLTTRGTRLTVNTGIPFPKRTPTYIWANKECVVPVTGIANEIVPVNVVRLCERC